MKLPAKIRQLVHVLRCSLLLLCSFLLANQAYSYNRLDAIQALQSVQTNSAGAGLQVWINNLKGDPDPGVLVGESVRFSVESDAASYYLLTLIDAKGETTLIAGDAAMQRLDFPPRGSADILEQGPPVGDQTLFVFASDTEFGLQELGLTAEEPVVTLPKDISAIETMAAVLNRHAGTGTLAVAPRYTYFVDDPNNQISTRGLKRVLKKKMVEMEKPAPEAPVIVASKEPEPETPVVLASKESEPEQPAVKPAEVATTTETATAEAVTTEAATNNSGASSALSLDIKFQYNSADLGDEGMAQLDALGSVLVSLLEAESLPKISLEGHTDDTGSADYNMSLSDKRAKSARAYLIDSYGLPDSSIEAYGMGESSPMVKNADKASRAQNRRVELRVLR